MRDDIEYIDAFFGIHSFIAFSIVSEDIVTHSGAHRVTGDVASIDATTQVGHDHFRESASVSVIEQGDRVHANVVHDDCFDGIGAFCVQSIGECCDIPDIRWPQVCVFHGQEVEVGSQQFRLCAAGAFSIHQSAEFK